jgi:probable phosphoglycerate mutase
VVGHGGVMDVLYRAATRLNPGTLPGALGNAAIAACSGAHRRALAWWAGADTSHLDDDASMR